MPLDTNPQPRLRNTLRDGLGSAVPVSGLQSWGRALQGGGEAGSEADLRRSYRAKTAAYEPSQCGLDRALSETRSFDVKADPVCVCYGGDGAADGRKTRPGLQSPTLLGLSGQPMRIQWGVSEVLLRASTPKAR